jgi:hypothetical protein
MTGTMAVKFSDVQNMLDAILANSNWAKGKSPPFKPQPHLTFWRQTGNYDEDYKRFTTGDIPGVGVPAMNTTPGQELTSNFYVVLTNPDGLPDLGVPQMPAGPVPGPFITDAGYQVNVGGSTMTGQQIQDALAQWLTNGHPK